MTKYEKAMEERRREAAEAAAPGVHRDALEEMCGCNFIAPARMKDAARWALDRIAELEGRAKALPPEPPAASADAARALAERIAYAMRPGEAYREDHPDIKAIRERRDLLWGRNGKHHVMWAEADQQSKLDWLIARLVEFASDAAREAMEGFDNLAKGQKSEDFKSVARRVAAQLQWAKGRLMSAQAEGDTMGSEAWYGYVQALQWVADTVLVEPPESSRPTANWLTAKLAEYAADVAKS